MLFSNPELVRAELDYRQARITEDYRRANQRREAKRAAEPKHSAGRRGMAAVRPAA